MVAQSFAFGANADDTRGERLDLKLNFGPSLFKLDYLLFLIRPLPYLAVALQRGFGNGSASVSQFIFEPPGLVGRVASFLFSARQLFCQATLLTGHGLELRLCLLGQTNQFAIVCDIHAAKKFAQLLPQDMVTPSLGGLTTQAVHLSVDF